MQNEALNLKKTTSDSLNRAVTPEASQKYREALELIQGFIKTVKSYRIYALNNPILTKFINQLHQKLTLYLEKHGSFRFSIDEFKFIFDGEVVYADENMEESLAFLMHRPIYKEHQSPVNIAPGLKQIVVKTNADIEKLNIQYVDDQKL